MLKSISEKIAYTMFGVILLGSAWFGGCQNTPKVQPKSAISDVHNIGTDVGKTGDDLKATTGIISKNATDGQKATPKDVKPTLDPYWNNILLATGSQQQIVLNLTELTKKVSTAEQKTADMEAWGIEQQKEKDAANDGVTKELREKYMAYSGTLFLLSLVCLGIAVFSKGNKLALYGGLLLGAASAVCIFIVQSVAIIPWIVAGLGVIALGLLVYSLFFKNKTATVLTAAVKENVETVEAAKPHMTVAGRRKVFGDGPGKGDAYSIQSVETEAIVKRMRKEIENAPKIPATVAADWNGDGVIDDRDVCPDDLVSPAQSSMPSKKTFIFR